MHILQGAPTGTYKRSSGPKPNHFHPCHESEGS